MTVNLAFCFIAGMLIGLFYFGGLWWTISRLPVTDKPVFWMMGSFFFRTLLSLSAFYFAAGGRWEGIMACLCGFFLVRLSVMVRVKSGGGH
jgi:F1F0 ATPase subunit 2